MTTTHRIADRPLYVLACMITAALFLAPQESRSQDLIDPTVHWAYASFFGTGWYRINDERSAFMLRVTPRWSVGEAGIDKEGNREIAYTFRLPMTLGVANFDFEDIPGIIDPDNFSTASLNFGVDADIPVTRRFSARPSIEVGYGQVLGESDSAWTYKGAVQGRYTFQSGRLDWSLLGGLGVAGYKPNEGPSDYFSFLKGGAEFGYPVSWPRSKNDQTMLYWHVTYTNFLDEIEFKTGIEELDAIASFWQVGMALGKRKEPIRLWFLKFDRLGLAYNFSSSGELRGVKFVFASAYDL
jgi:hypothetical protein